MAKPGARNLITDVAGLRIGQAEDHRLLSGTTVLIADEAVFAAVDVRGGAPGTRETDVLDPVNLVGQADAIVLSGGSAFGLDAASGVMQFLAGQGRGFRINPAAPAVPIVPAAILFDLANGGDKDWGETAPYRALGIKAAQNAGLDFKLGNTGAGLGAMAGIYKGGLGSASFVTDDGITVGAIVAVNALGSPFIPGSDIFWAWPLEQAGEFGGRVPLQPIPPITADLPADMKGRPGARQNTSIAIVATDAALDRNELQRLAIMASDGFARSLRPSHTPFDGDLVFAVSTAKVKTASGPRDTMRLGSLAADCLARAVARGVHEAVSVGAHKSCHDHFGK